MSHVTHMNKPCYTYEWVMPHIWISHVTHMNELCHTYEWVMWHIWISHVTHMNESCDTYKWVMSHMNAHVRTQPIGRTGGKTNTTHGWRPRFNHMHGCRSLFILISILFRSLLTFMGLFCRSHSTHMHAAQPFVFMNVFLLSLFTFMGYF